ncbi:MAG: hypothetical protein U1G07_15620 [Verrucomicrobiota bacterium]
MPTRSSAGEVHLAICRDRGIPVLRRCTGGGAVVQVQACLNSAFVLNTADPAFATVNSTNRYVMGKNQKALAPLLRAPVQIQGHTDSPGQSQVLRQRPAARPPLLTGALLDFNLQLIQDLLRPPPNSLTIEPVVPILSSCKPVDRLCRGQARPP